MIIFFFLSRQTPLSIIFLFKIPTETIAMLSNETLYLIAYILKHIENKLSIIPDFTGFL